MPQVDLVDAREFWRDATSAPMPPRQPAPPSSTPPRLRLVRGAAARREPDPNEAELLAIKAGWTRELREERGTRWLLANLRMLKAQWAEMLAVGLLP